MTEEISAPAGADITALELPANAPDAFSSPSSAAKYYLSLREKQNSSGERADGATAETELSDEDNAAPDDQAHSEEDAADPADNQPPIEPPNSWTKAEKDCFAALPRETQEYIQAREQEREREFRRG